MDLKTSKIDLIFDNRLFQIFPLIMTVPVCSESASEVQSALLIAARFHYLQFSVQLDDV